MPVLTIPFILLFAIFIFLLFAPIAVSFSGSTDRANILRIRVWPLPYLKFSFAPTPAGPPRKKARPKKQTAARHRMWRRFDMGKIDSSYLIKIIKESLRLLLGLYRSLGYKKIEFRLSGGFFGDPCIAGQIYGACRAVESLIPNWLIFSYEPEYLADDLNISFSFEIEFRLAWILANLLVFLIRIPKIKTAAIILGR